jgi:hypothetical protein
MKIKTRTVVSSGDRNRCIIKSKKTFCMTFLLFLIPLNSLLFTQPEHPAKILEVKKYGKGELRIIEGIPFIKLAGTYYEMGKDYGTLLKEEFQKIYHELLPYKSVILAKQPNDLPRKLEQLTPEKYLQQIRGMSDGSGVPYDDLLLAAYFGVLERGGCSSILAIINNQNIPRLLHGRNLDYGKGTGQYPIVIEYQPAGEFKHLAIGTIASGGVSEGINEKGITVSSNLAPGNLRNHLIQNPSPDIKFREILSSASFLKDVDDLITGYACDVGNTFSIGSGHENDAVIYDMNYENVKKNYFNGQNHLFATNGYVHQDLNPDKDDLRYQIIRRYVHEGKVNSVDGMIDVLSDPGTSFGVNNPSTIHSVVFDPKNKTVYMAFHPRFAAWGQWQKYDWEKDLVTVYKKADKDKLQQIDIAELREVHITGAYWNGNLPVMGGGPKSNEPNFWIEIKEWLKEKNVEQLIEFRKRAAKELTLRAKDKPDVKATVTRGMIAKENFRGFMFKINEEDIPKLEPNIPYTIHIENTSAIFRWVVEEGVQLIKPGVKGAELFPRAFDSILLGAMSGLPLAFLFPCGAGHDARNMARLAPAGMIFIPSRGGVGHSPLELTAAEQITAGPARVKRDRPESTAAGEESEKRAREKRIEPDE